MLIVDMPMPTKCGECPLLVMGVCMPLADIIGKTLEKTDKCPIKGELVRCKDCKHYEPLRTDDGYCEWHQELYRNDWFCADGVRKEKDDG